MRSQSICRHCGKTFFYYPHWGSRYCSRECRDTEVIKDPAVRFWSYVDTSGECWVWTGARFNGGYGAFSCNGGQVKAHRFIYAYVYGPIPDRLWVLHHCDNPPCVRPNHLYAGTATDNNRDTVRRGRRNPAPRREYLRGSMQPTAKLTDDAVVYIRRSVARGVPIVALVAEFGTSYATVQHAAIGRTWRHVDESPVRRSDVRRAHRVTNSAPTSLVSGRRDSDT